MTSSHPALVFTLLLFSLPPLPAYTASPSPALCLRGGALEMSKVMQADPEGFAEASRKGAEFIKSISSTAALSFDNNMRPVAGKPICATLEECKRHNVMPGSIQIIPIYSNFSQVQELPGVKEGLCGTEKPFLSFATEESADARHLYGLARVFADNNVSGNSMGIFNEENENRDEEVYRKIEQLQLNMSNAEVLDDNCREFLDLVFKSSLKDEAPDLDAPSIKRAKRLYEEMSSAAADGDSLLPEPGSPFCADDVAGDLERMERLLSEGAPMNPTSFKANYSPLIYAASYGHAEACKFLLEGGANVSGRSFYNGTALHYAAAKGHLEVCKVLLEYGADPNSFAQWGGTPMEWALETYQIEIARFLSGMTGEYNQLGRDHPRTWLGSDIEIFWAAVKEANVTLAKDGYWKRLLAMREQARAEKAARRQQRKPTRRKDPRDDEVVLPKKKVKEVAGDVALR